MDTNTQIMVRNKTMTRSISASGLLPASSDKTLVKTRVYSLNKAKSLEKKSVGCSKEHMKCEVKQGNKVVIEMSTAAFELSKACLNELLRHKNFPYYAEKNDGVEQSGATVDTCFRVFNKKADGSCGKKLKFVINLYHTTSVIVVNGSRTDIFLSEIHNELCSQMAARCKDLDIMNINIASTINRDSANNKHSSNEPMANKQITQDSLNKEISTQSFASQETINIEDDSEDKINDNSEQDVCEICPACLNQAYGKVVQCGECGDWYHFDCLRISDITIQTLGDDDYVCRMCTDNLLHIDTGTGTNDMSVEAMNESIGNPPHVPGNPDVSMTGLEDESENIEKPLKVFATPDQIKKKDLLDKCKPKKSSKVNKMKKEEAVDKSYIIDLENQIKMLKSTIDLYQKTTKNGQPSSQSSAQTGIHSGEPKAERETDSCRHRCCNDIYEKLQENRLRMLETQMMQNMFIQNAMHIQAITQTRPHYSMPEVQFPSPNANVAQQFMAPFQQPPCPAYRPYPVHYQTQMNMYHQTPLPSQGVPHPYPPLPNGYIHAAAGQHMPGAMPYPTVNRFGTGIVPTIPPPPPVLPAQPQVYHQQPPLFQTTASTTNTGMQSQQPNGPWTATHVPRGTNENRSFQSGQPKKNANKLPQPPRAGKYLGKKNEWQHGSRDEASMKYAMSQAHIVKNPIHVNDLEEQDLSSTGTPTKIDAAHAVNKATETNNPRKRQLEPIDSNDMEDIIEEKRIHMCTQKDNSPKVTE